MSDQRESTIPRRVVLTGSESVGKTTLATELAARYGVPLVPEFVRDYATAKGAPLDFTDHGPIAWGQVALEDTAIAAARAAGHGLIVHDTDLVSTVAYCHHYFGRCPAFLEELALARRADLYLLLDIDVPWVADGVRDRGDRRAEVHRLFGDTLSRLGARVTLIQGPWDERLTTARHHIDSLLADDLLFPD
jgi:NadR type nicotinamide-nucleotide adenylyltransferase